MLVAQEFASRRSVESVEEERARSREAAVRTAAGAGYLLALHPGEHVELPLRIHGPSGHSVAVRGKGFHAM